MTLIGVDGEVLWVMARLPKSLPEGWRMRAKGLDGAKYLRDDGLSVIVSGAVELDGRRWLHVSCARPDRLPSWDELRTVKELFIGPDEYAVQVLPPRKHYVNINPFVLHVFSCVEGHPLPEFTRGGRTL